MPEAITFRLASKADEADIVRFVNEHWNSRHPLVNLRDFFVYYYDAGDGSLRFALAFNGQRLVAVAGFVPASQGPQADIWVSLWAADKSARGAGLELMAALPQLTGCRTLACNNIRPETRAFYEFLGYTTGRAGHFYRLAKRQEYKAASLQTQDIPPVNGEAALTLCPTPHALLARGFTPPPNANPYKDLWYILRRYYEYPRQQYNVYTACLPGEATPQALLATRTVPVLGTHVLRIADYIGEASFLPQLGNAIDGLLLQEDAEYAELYCAGLSSSLLRQAGFAERMEGDSNILPHYLTPPLIENVDFYYFTSRPDGFVLFRADGDQDRPHTPV